MNIDNNNDNNLNNTLINKSNILYLQKIHNALNNIQNIYHDLNYDNNKIYIKNENLLNIIYENNFFNCINISIDGNCLYNYISYYLFRNERKSPIIRNKVYNYIISNKTLFYEYCYIENNKYYINVEENNRTIKYFIEDYFEKIKEKGFYGGFMEIHALSKIYHKHIIVLVEKFDYNTKIYYYEKLIGYNFINKDKIDIEDIISSVLKIIIIIIYYQLINFILLIE